MVITEEMKKIPKSWKYHNFSHDEKLMLLNGDYVFANDFVGKNGNKFPCHVKLDKSKENKKGEYFIKADFNKL